MCPVYRAEPVGEFGEVDEDHDGAVVAELAGCDRACSDAHSDSVSGEGGFHITENCRYYGAVDRNQKEWKVPR